ncbi:MAG: Rrf2 family transcriptional regulator [Chitinophagales bacterium]
MMFSKSCEYAIKAVIHLCMETHAGGRLSINDIAIAIDSPEPFTAKILQTLSKHKIISSAKGPGGGFYVEQKKKPIYVMDIVHLMDGEDALNRCGLGLKECNEEHPCPIHNEFKSYSSRLKKLLETKTIQQFAAEIKTGKAFLNN